LPAIAHENTLPFGNNLWLLYANIRIFATIRVRLLN